MKTAFDWILRLFLVAVFGFAAATKLRDPASFATDIENFHLLSSGPAALLAVYLPWVELLVAAGLLLPRWKAAAALLAVMLLAIFTLAVAVAWARGLDITCGCFGHAEAAPLGRVLARDLVLLVASIAVLRLSVRKPGS